MTARLHGVFRCTRMAGCAGARFPVFRQSGGPDRIRFSRESVPAKDDGARRAGAKRPAAAGTEYGVPDKRSCDFYGLARSRFSFQNAAVKTVFLSAPGNTALKKRLPAYGRRYPAPSGRRAQARKRAVWNLTWSKAVSLPGCRPIRRGAAGSGAAVCRGQRRRQGEIMQNGSRLYALLFLE